MCPFCFPFYPLSQRILLPSRLKHCFWDYPRPVLPSTRTCSAATGFVPGLSSLPPVPAADCPLPHAVIARCAAKPALPTGGSPSQQSKSKQAAPPGASGKTRQSKRHPLSGRCPVLFLGSFFLPAGFIPGSGGFPECSAQHRTVRRRATVKSAAEEAAHRRSKWRCPDQAGMPSVRWQWLYGARH